MQRYQQSIAGITAFFFALAGGAAVWAQNLTQWTQEGAVTVGADMTP
jgi:hypothetical protein